MHARQASVDGLVALQYSVYLTHALILSSAEMAAHDLKRMPLHRFGAPLTPDQVVEVPLSTVGGLRPFHLFVLFTFVEGHTEGVAEQLSKQCKDCAAAIKTFRKVSKAYKLSDSEPGNDDLFPVIFGVVNVGTRDGAAISAIHPAMQLPVALYLPPTFSSSVENRRDRSSSSSGVSTTVAAEDKAVEAEVDRGSLHVALHKITSAEFFTETLGEWEEDAVLRDLLLQQQKQGIHGKVHFFSVPQNHLLLLQRRKNEASPEQKLLEWVNAHTSRHQWLIPVGGVVAYTMCSGGMVFSIIHSVPFMGYDEIGMRYVLLAPTSRAQYLLEGLLISSCSTLASLAALGLLRTPYLAKTAVCSPSTDKGETGCSVISTSNGSQEMGEAVSCFCKVDLNE
ncbi:uncharacterized protein LOC34619762 [Cyclospora cayetanensis]|uniref:Uncharacterized protein LOC34619762 n=1 Tax=Cyclospora cayetanensis TaxID=88456 RepID=A0A6P5WDM9_9EIME|nr:uncharacterized protein LOC34619762 [Cyclospora cayetanensis]